MDFIRTLMRDMFLKALKNKISIKTANQVNIILYVGVITYVDMMMKETEAKLASKGHTASPHMLNELRDAWTEAAIIAKNANRGIATLQ